MFSLTTPDYKLFIPPKSINLVKKLSVPVLNEALHHEIERGTNREAQTYSELHSQPRSMTAGDQVHAPPTVRTQDGTPVRT